MIYFGKKKMPLHRLILTSILLTIASVSVAQQHLIISHSNDTMKGRIMEVEKKFVLFINEALEPLKIPHSSILKAVRDGLNYPVLNGRLSLFPFIDNEKAGLFEVVESQGKSSADLYKQAVEVVNTSYRDFNRQAEGSTVATTYAILGVHSASTQVVDMMFKNDSPVKFSDPSSQSLIVKIVNRYEGGGFGCVRLVWWEYDMILKFKDGRYRIELTNFRYSHFSNANSAMKIQFYVMQDGGDCSSTGNMEDLLRCQYCLSEFSQMYSYLIGDSRKLMRHIRQGLEKKAQDKGDDW